MSQPNPYLQPGRFGPREHFGRPRNGGPDWKRIILSSLGAVSMGFVGVLAFYGGSALIGLNSARTLDIEPSSIAFIPPPDVTETVTLEPVDPVKDRTTILMVGSDSRKGLTKEQLAAIGTADDGSDLTDTIILAQLNPQTDQVALLSMPRDLVIRRCDGTKGRINEAWYVGELQGKDQGAACLVQTIEQHTGIGIDHVVRVNFSGFVNVVDTLGGVDFAVDQDMRDRWSGLDIKKGCNHFDGVKAIQFVRARHIDSDFGRQARQQRFAREMIKKATSLGTLANPVKVTGIINSAFGAIETDKGLDAAKLVDIALSMRNITPEKLVAVSVPATNGRLGEAAVLFENKKDAEKIYSAFRTGKVVELDLSDSPADTPSTPSDPGVEPSAPGGSGAPIPSPGASAPSSSTMADPSVGPSATSVSPTPDPESSPSGLATPGAKTSASSSASALPGASASASAPSVPGVPGVKAPKQTYAGSFDPGISCP